MAKQDVLNAINTTIATNNTKGITAESLNNVLTMMVENAGEGGGSGDGALKILVPDMIVGITIVEEGAFSLETISELRELLLELSPEEAEMFDPYFVECENAIAHNADVFATIKEKADNGEGCMVLLDQSYLFKSYIDCIANGMPEITEMYESQSVAMSQVGNVTFAYIDIVSDYEELIGGDMITLAIRPTKSADILDMEMSGYPTNMLLMLQPDGSIIFEQIEEDDINNKGVLTFYADNTGTITNDQKTHNANSYRKFKEDDTIYAVAIKRNNGSVNQPTFIANDDDIRCDWLSPMNGVLYMQSIRFASDGSFEWSSINAL